MNRNMKKLVKQLKNYMLNNSFCQDCYCIFYEYRSAVTELCNRYYNIENSSHPVAEQLYSTTREGAISERLVGLYHPVAKQSYGRGTIPEELKEIGCRLRVWRIQTGVSRAALARELNIEPQRLLFLEMGDAQSEDFTEAQLRKLAAVVTQSYESIELKGFGC